MPDVVRLTDLAVPQFSDDVNAIFDVMGTMADGLRLDADQLHALASEQTGLSDFGARDYSARLEVLLAALREVDDLTPGGLLNLHSQVLQMLKNRLRLVDLLARNPEIAASELVPPLVIAGLPRTGTTHLHNLLSAAPTYRSLPYWESVEPFPAPEEGADIEPRRERTGQATWFADEAMPYFKRMHEMTTDHVHEEIQLLANDFSTMFFETIAEVPAWRDHYLASDQTPHYAHLRLQLKALQHLRGGGPRWLLKSPQHLEQLPVLNAVFPDATVVITHRDPVAVTVSMATMVAYTARMHRTPVPVERIGAYWADRIELMLGSLVRDRDVLDPERSVDIRFADFMADDLATARSVVELSGEPVTAEAEAAMQAYLDGHQRDRHGRIDYRAEDLGLDEDDLRQRFSGYRARFGV
ncbi:sulfotransferase family protein [Nocardioides marmorisolisilvae]|uniref:Sulfotransferase n=1 Tax=Nocardioides marmorisolisilvae TaxID=1542737 RepID=A0A3N0DW21_9ACTN|nr:sulfotransferase [Nocardioides marmorisolisilvae]RNL79686.1 sulfotransferase [Nocardioides marmorisolisilvae]